MAPSVDVYVYTQARSVQGSCKISPNGEYYAATVPLEDRTALVVLDRATDKSHRHLQARARTTTSTNFSWITPQRLVIVLSEKIGAAGAAAGSTANCTPWTLTAASRRCCPAIASTMAASGTTIKPKKDNDSIAAFLIDTIAYPADARMLFGDRWSLNRAADTYSSAERMDLYNGRHARVASSPVRDASFDTRQPGRGALRRRARIPITSASCSTAPATTREWQLLSIEKERPVRGRRSVSPWTTRSPTCEVEQANGPDSLVALRH